MIRSLYAKIILALLVTVFVPLGLSVFLVNQAVDTTLGLGLNAELAAQLERGLESQRALIEELKRSARARFEHLLDSRALAAAAEQPAEDEIRAALAQLVESDPSLRLIRLHAAEGRVLEVEAVADPGPGAQRTVTMRRAAGLGPYTELEAVFGVDEELIDSYRRAGEEFATYAAIVEAQPNYLEDRFVWAYLTLLGITAVVCVVFGMIWATHLVRRVHRLARATARVAEGDLSVRVGPGARDEVGLLVESFNGMLAELETSRARIEYLQKISAWQEMARRLAHEIKNPLTPIHLAAQQLREKYPDDGPEQFGRLVSQSTEIIEEEVATLRRLTSDFSSFAKLPAVRPEPVEIGEFLEECEASLKPELETQGVALEIVAPGAPLELAVDRMMLRRVIDNLVRNAGEAVVAAGVGAPLISVSAERRKLRRKRSELEIRVRDNGPGVGEEHAANIFDPYYTTKGEGTGLGLAICKKIVLEHGGRIWIDDRDEQPGACFVLVLPCPSAGLK